MATKPNELLDKITPQGIDFINYVCTPNSNDRLTGSWNYPMTNGTIKRKEVLTAHVIDHEGNVVTNNKQLANALISWYNKYGKDFNINPNILAAQGYHESSYKVYAYPPTSTAMGVSQFTLPTTYDRIVKNNLGAFTPEEIAKITKNVVPISGEDIKYIKNYFIVTNTRNGTVSTKEESNVAISNNSIIFQNIMDNPDIMIKAQAALLANINKNHANVAASSLILYMAGPAIGGGGTNNFGELFDKLYNIYPKPSTRVFDGMKYVRQIFEALGGKAYRLGGRGFGFDIDFTKKLEGEEIKNSSLSHKLRIPHKKT